MAETKKKTRKRNPVSEIRVAPVVTLRGMVGFPFMVLPLFVGRDRSVRALEAANDADKSILLVAQRDESVEEPGKDDLYSFGIWAKSCKC